MIRFFLFIVGILIMPLFWLCFNIVLARVTLAELYKDFIETYKSGEKFGALG